MSPLDWRNDYLFPKSELKKGQVPVVAVAVEVMGEAMAAVVLPPSLVIVASPLITTRTVGRLKGTLTSVFILTESGNSESQSSSSVRRGTSLTKYASAS